MGRSAGRSFRRHVRLWCRRCISHRRYRGHPAGPPGEPGKGVLQRRGIPGVRRQVAELGQRGKGQVKHRHQGTPRNRRLEPYPPRVEADQAHGGSECHETSREDLSRRTHRRDGAVSPGFDGVRHRSGTRVQVPARRQSRQCVPSHRRRWGERMRTPLYR